MKKKNLVVWTAVASGLSLLLAVASNAAPVIQANAGWIMTLVAVACAAAYARSSQQPGASAGGGLVLGGLSTLIGVAVYGLALNQYETSVIAFATLVGAAGGALGAACAASLQRVRSRSSLAR